MEEIISKKEFDELMKLEGEAKGVPFKTEANFILKREGGQGLKKLEDTMAKLGYPIKYRKMRSMNLYPLGLLAVNLLAIKRLFNYDNKKFQEMGSVEAKTSSLIIRLFMKYFVSIERAAKEISKMWRKHYTTGDLKIIEYDKKKKYAILRLKDFRCSSLFCQDLIGYFPSVLQMIIGSKVNCEEVKCIHRGDEYHEFLLKW
jgi:hypothetical protein